MKAIVLRAHDPSPRALEYVTDWPDPVAGEGNVVIAVRACALNYHDLFTLRGMPGIKVPMPIITGIDMAGEIVEVGPGVTGFTVGDRVLVDPFDRVAGKLIGEMMNGGLAEYCEVGAHTLLPLDDAISFEDAAALPTAYGTAYRMIRRRGRVARDEKVLVLGASGGVGTCCVQLAAAEGAHVIAAASTAEKLARLEELGAHELINYVEHDFREAIIAKHGKPRMFGGGGIDVIVNFTGGDTWAPSLRTLTKGGRLLTCGATAGFDPKTDIRYIWTFELNILGSNGWAREDVEELLELVRQKKLRPMIDRVLPLEKAQEAFTLLDSREVFGKIIVSPTAA
ncbi:SDR family NAD(P)-dependent oxidoreductase [Microbacterium soli]|uniref:Zinc-binding dehydrogenase n=1 Tax=Microbacterium soli TaxID=446075 RepID=A0ABP7NCY1_9MICO